jgi:UDPglucose 6-dehydrogenase
VGLKNEVLLPALRDLFRGVEGPWMVATPTNAEMIKYSSNAFLATKISLVNELANLCDEVGATIDDVVAGMGLDPRIGTSFMHAGVGYGGSCFPKDVRALAHLSSLSGHSMPMLEAVITVNNNQRLRPIRILRDAIRDPAGQTAAVLGVSFKPGTDDVRESPSRHPMTEPESTPTAHALP